MLIVGVGAVGGDDGGGAGQGVTAAAVAAMSAATLWSKVQIEKQGTELGMTGGVKGMDDLKESKVRVQRRLPQVPGKKLEGESEEDAARRVWWGDDMESTEVEGTRLTVLNPGD